MRIGVTAAGHWNTDDRSFVDRRVAGSTGEGPTESGTGMPGSAVVADAVLRLFAVVADGLGTAVTTVDVAAGVAGGGTGAGSRSAQAASPRAQATAEVAS